LPDFKNIREQLQRHSHLTLQLIWSEYREQQADGYSYSQFCELYQRWRAKQDVVLCQDHKAGERLFVDWAGATIPVCTAETGEVWQAPLFVAVLGASSYTYAEATRTAASAPCNGERRSKQRKKSRADARLSLLTTQVTYLYI
jgi:transposase